MGASPLGNPTVGRAEAGFDEDMERRPAAKSIPPRKRLGATQLDIAVVAMPWLSLIGVFAVVVAQKKGLRSGDKRCTDGGCGGVGVFQPSGAAERLLAFSKPRTSAQDSAIAGSIVALPGLCVTTSASGPSGALFRHPSAHRHRAGTERNPEDENGEDVQGQEGPAGASTIHEYRRRPNPPKPLQQKEEEEGIEALLGASGCFF
ncbi:hypothetical protein CC78DRAFT_577615 [Lojkania enalia]|uniref:Transmembrane protein n=1 Tax=Lojkania enalia TaxID=147567 RepID=A0A9P4KE94_9PLEO|nr:hypothetical protein CC78DRAFT_577615 [Didymosphaeria enalia]